MGEALITRKGGSAGTEVGVFDFKEIPCGWTYEATGYSNSMDFVAPLDFVPVDNTLYELRFYARGKDVKTMYTDYDSNGRIIYQGTDTRYAEILLTLFVRYNYQEPYQQTLPNGQTTTVYPLCWANYGVSALMGTLYKTENGALTDGRQLWGVTDVTWENASSDHGGRVKLVFDSEAANVVNITPSNILTDTITMSLYAHSL